MNAARFDALTKSLAKRRGFVQTERPRTEAPVASFRARNLAGRMVSLATLLTPKQPLLLIFAHPACGPCYELLPNIAGWQRVYRDRLTVAVVSSGTVEQNHAMTIDDGIDAGLVLVQEGRELAARFGITMAPAAVVVGRDRHVVGEPVLGADAIRQLVAETLGLGLRPTLAQTGSAVTVGDLVPLVRRPTINGDVVELGGRQDTATMLLFVSPGCTHCEDLLPHIRRWETRAEGPRLVVISRGPIGLNRNLTLRSPMILDDDYALAERFGVMGTPAAVLVDGGGMVASRVARGASQVRAFGDQLWSGVRIP